MERFCSAFQAPLHQGEQHESCNYLRIKPLGPKLSFGCFFRIKNYTLSPCGWVHYFKIADMKMLPQEIDGWMRGRLRMVFWKRWKKVKTKYKNLKRLGLSEKDAKKMANTRKGDWRISRGYEIIQVRQLDRSCLSAEKVVSRAKNRNYA